jgi:hypothetical protein
MPQDDPKIARLRAALDAATDQPVASVHIQGSGNIVGDGNQIIHTPVVRVCRTITPPPNAVTPAQKLKLKDALYALSYAHISAGASESEHPALLDVGESL